MVGWGVVCGVFVHGSTSSFVPWVAVSGAVVSFALLACWSGVGWVVSAREEKIKNKKWGLCLFFINSFLVLETQ